MGLPDHVLIKLSHDLSRRGDPIEERLRAAAAALFLLENALAKFDALSADVNVPWSFDQRTNIAVALSTE